jgi:hypothetical protein
MESRREPRFGADRPIVVSLPAGRRPARMLSAAAWSISIEMDAPTAPGTPIWVELGDSTAAGEVASCRAAGGSYYIGVKLEQPLRALSGLAFLLDENPPVQDRL